MNINRMTCDPDRIELFLQQKLSDAEQTAFESHLDDCHDCRRHLEAAAAGDDAWSEVRDSLRGRQLPSDCLRPGDPGLDSAAGDDALSSHGMVLKLLAPTDDERSIGRLGTYEVVGVVGSGGMGVVLKAFDAPLNRYVAIKVLAPHLGSSATARKRFLREAQAAAAVVHDNVIEIHGVADAEGLPYLVMPYVRGPSLQRRLDDEGPLALVQILRIGMQAAAGLAAAHAQGLVHRDVKPANILLDDGVERVKLTDFGLARAADDASLTRTGTIAGTPQYMSPEQARGEPVDQRSDLFSLGSVLYAMCTGRAPFRAETSYGVLRRITDEEPRPIREINPEIPDWLCGVVGKLMAKRPDDRFQSADEVAKLLEECLAHVQQPIVVRLPNCVPLRRAGMQKPRLFAGLPGRTRYHFALVGLLFFGGLGLAAGMLIHVKKNNKTATVEVPEGSTAHVDSQGAVTVDLPSSGVDLDYLFGERAIPAPALRKMEEAFGKAGFNGYTVEGSHLKVPRAERANYLAALADAGALPPNIRLLIEKEKELKELAVVISRMKGIEHATVLVDSQAQPGSDNSPLKTASVSVETIGDAPLDNDQVDKIRNYVAATITGMKPECVTVVATDGNIFTGPGTARDMRAAAHGSEAGHGSVKLKDSDVPPGERKIGEPAPTVAGKQVPKAAQQPLPVPSLPMTIQQLKVEGSRMLITGRVPAGATISLFAGDNLDNALRRTFPNTGSFTATLEIGSHGLSCFVVPHSGNPILALDLKQAKAQGLFDGFLAAL